MSCCCYAVALEEPIPSSWLNSTCSTLYCYIVIYVSCCYLYRISVIFRVRSAKAVKITDLDLMKRLGIIVGIFAALLVIRTLVSPPIAVVSYTAQDLKAWLCQSDWWDHSFTISKSNNLTKYCCVIIIFP